MTEHHVDPSCALWRKSSHSKGDASTCVEVATNLPGVVAVRDSTDPEGPVLMFKPTAWRSLTGWLKNS